MLRRGGTTRLSPRRADGAVPDRWHRDMIRENQKLLNRLNVLSDVFISYIMIPVAYWLRFNIMSGIETIQLQSYLRLGIFVALLQVFTLAAFGLYQSTRKTRIRQEVARVLAACLLDVLLLIGWLYLRHDINYSRWVLAIYYLLSAGTLAFKRAFVRISLGKLRASGRNLKHVLLIGGGQSARKYLDAVRGERQLGYRVIGYIAKAPASELSLPYLGGYEELERVLNRLQPDEVVSAIEMTDYELTPHIIQECERAGIKLAIIPFYAEYMPARPQFDDLGGIPMLNIRRIPLDNFANAFVKRFLDLAAALVLIVLLSPVFLACAIGVKLSSPGPVLFRQTRVGKNRKPFNMYKFRSLVVNTKETTAWTKKSDDRRTVFGSFIRKYSLDELPQLFCVVAGTMSLVGPRPEIPHFVDQFKDEIPLYMVRHQVRPGMTGWAQINGFRGDTPIKERVEHDLWYIENWSLWLDILILLRTAFGGFVNEEESKKKAEAAKETETAKETEQAVV